MSPELKQQLSTTMLELARKHRLRTGLDDRIAAWLDAWVGEQVELHDVLAWYNEAFYSEGRKLH